MILWGIASFGLYYGSFCTTKHSTRQTCLKLLMGWLIASVLLLMIGSPVPVAD